MVAPLFRARQTERGVYESRQRLLAANLITSSAESSL